MNYLLFEMVANEIAKATNLTLAEIHERLEQPPDSAMGDVAFPCFTLARVMKKSPQAIAEDLRTQLVQSTTPLFCKLETSGGYLNFYLDKTVVLQQFFERVQDNKLIDFSAYKGQTITIEHTSVNPNASPHIGRARNAMIGDACVRLFKILGCDVNVRYFVNDIGKQIAILVCCTMGKTDIGFNDLLSLYVAANDNLKNDPEMEAKVFELLHRMENGDEAVFSEFSRVVDICIKGQMAIFSEFGIFYDSYDYESQYVQSGKTDEVLAALQNTQRLFEDADGRLVLNLEEFNINPENPYLPLTRGDKTSLYPLRDICYNIDKAKADSHRNIVVLGEDQRLYGRQINAALSLLGIQGAEIINYSYVLLPEGKMSTRAGQVVLLEDLMRDTVAYAKATIAQHRNSANHANDPTDPILPKQLAYGAIKYSILKCGNEKNVVFDPQKALNFQGDTSVYIQYSYARIQSLLKGESVSICADDISLLSHPLEWEIAKKLLCAGQILHAITQDFNFTALCGYLFELCQLFSRWYKECPIKTADENLRNPRLFLASTVAGIIKDGLYILGIDAPEKI